MKTVIFALAALAVATPVAAEVYLVSATDDYVTYADEKTVRIVAPGKTRVWFDIVKRATSDADGPYTEKRLNEYDCGKDTYRMISGVEYDASGDISDTYNYNDDLRTLDVVPGSAASSHYDFACTPADRTAFLALPPGADLVKFTREVEKAEAEEAEN